jgi:hypothetical protein
MKNVERDVLGIQRSAGGSQGGAAKFVQKDAEMSTKVDLTGIAGEDARFKESCWYGAAVVEIWRKRLWTMVSENRSTAGEVTARLEDASFQSSASVRAGSSGVRSGGSGTIRVPRKGGFGAADCGMDCGSGPGVVAGGGGTVENFAGGADGGLF